MLLLRSPRETNNKMKSARSKKTSKGQMNLLKTPKKPTSMRTRFRCLEVVNSSWILTKRELNMEIIFQTSFKRKKQKLTKNKMQARDLLLNFPSPD